MAFYEEKNELTIEYKYMIMIQWRYSVDTTEDRLSVTYWDQV